MTAHAEPVSNVDLYDILCHLEGAATTCADPSIAAPPAILRRTIDRHPGLFAAAQEYRNMVEAGWPLFDDATAVRAFFTTRTGANPFAAPF